MIVYKLWYSAIAKDEKNSEALDEYNGDAGIFSTSDLAYKDSVSFNKMLRHNLTKLEGIEPHQYDLIFEISEVEVDTNNPELVGAYTLLPDGTATSGYNKVIDGVVQFEE